MSILSKKNPRWQFWIDVGGTFTDCVGIDPDGNQHFTKVLSNGPAPITAIRQLLELPENQPLPPLDIRLGTTRGTNALLTRRGAKVCFVTTKGFGDLLRIGFQNRPDIFAIDVQKPEQLFCQTLEVNERVHYDGEVEITLDEAAVRAQLIEVKASGIESLAVCLIHAYRFTEHETRIAEIAKEIGFEEISLSHQVAPEIRMIPRAYTTVLDAYLNPILRQYVNEIRSHLHPESTMMMFSSSGSLMSTDKFTGKDSILSGPAGGVVGFSKSAQLAGIDKSIGFDMGGTSTDVSRFDGEYTYQYESQKSGIYIVAPTLAIETVAAGGGSICHFDGLRLQVGPQSAGADPGPACYGKGGPLSLSDINLFLNRIHAETFPIKIDFPAVEQRLDQVRKQMVEAGLPERDNQWIAEGFLKIAVAKTAEAIRLVSIQKGYDCAEYALVAFGGAAGQIACLVAEELNIKQILCHPQAGILSAVGIGLADQTEHDSVGCYRPLESLADLEQQFEELETSRTAASQNLPSNTVFSRKVDVRYQGTESWLTIPFQNLAELPQHFEQEHQRRFGYVQDRPLEVGCLRLETKTLSAIGTSSVAPLPVVGQDSSPNAPDTPASDTASVDTALPFIDRSTLVPGSTFAGPAMICDPLSTVIVDEGWTAECRADYQLVLTQAEKPPTADDDAQQEVDQVQVELLNNHLFSIAEQMGEALRATAVSVNVKERLDFSCAIFDGDGNLIANAPHIPIHLGAMSECVKWLIKDNPVIHPGDTFVTNDPYRGGSHLPDITVVTPVFSCLESQESRFAPRTVSSSSPPSSPPSSSTNAPPSSPSSSSSSSSSNPTQSPTNTISNSPNNPNSSKQIAERSKSRFAPRTVSSSSSPSSPPSSSPSAPPSSPSSSSSSSSSNTTQSPTNTISNSPNNPNSSKKIAERSKSRFAPRTVSSSSPSISSTSSPTYSSSPHSSSTSSNPTHSSSNTNSNSPGNPNSSKLIAERSATMRTKDPKPTFWVASRAHHAEIGGKVPGSMPPDSSNLAEEGVLIQNFKLIDGSHNDQAHFDALFQLLTSGPYPSRQPDLNLSDIKAQVAANRLGIQALSELTDSRPPGVLTELISRIYQLASVETRRVIASLQNDTYHFADYLDCGAKVTLQIKRQNDRLTFDFTGSSPTLSNNLNANSAIVHSAIIYCLRMLIGKDIPLNQGILEPIDIVLPECFLNPTPAGDPAQSPAIVGGNVETSQRVVDVILGALEVAAASQGTSNNVIFGDEEFGYYETVCGGDGASPTSDGADAIQCHITNTRITDPEILETRYPVILEEFSIRSGSGGAGQHRGGNGVIRKLRFRRPLQLSVLCNRYHGHVPFGLHGGQPGQPGELTTSPHGLTLKTPGGGGYGKALI